jgi:hypothetical protein
MISSFLGTSSSDHNIRKGIQNTLHGGFKYNTGEFGKNLSRDPVTQTLYRR